METESTDPDAPTAPNVSRWLTAAFVSSCVEPDGTFFAEPIGADHVDVVEFFRDGSFCNETRLTLHQALVLLARLGSWTFRASLRDTNSAIRDALNVTERRAA